jgi:hypothetical protein
LPNDEEQLMRTDADLLGRSHGARVRVFDVRLLRLATVHSITYSLYCFVVDLPTKECQQAIQKIENRRGKYLYTFLFHHDQSSIYALYFID